MRSAEGPTLVDGTDAQQIIQPYCRTFYNGSGVAIPAGSAVVVDPTVTTRGLGISIKIAPASAVHARKIIGATLNAIPAGDMGLVQCGGIQNNVSVINGVAADSPLIGSAATAGMLIAATFVAGEYPVGLCLSLAAGNLATVYWWRKG